MPRDRQTERNKTEKIDRQTEIDNRKIVKKRMKLEIKKEIPGIQTKLKIIYICN